MIQQGFLKLPYFFLVIFAFLPVDFFLPWRAFSLVGIQTPHSRKGVSLTPKMTLSRESEVLQKRKDAVVNKFDLDRWQAGKITSFSQTCFAEYWDDLPSIVVAVDVPQANNTKLEENRAVVDPYDFFHRMALEKFMIKHIGDESIGGDNSIFFLFIALVLQRSELHLPWLKI